VSLHKPYSPACDNNRGPILAVLREQFTGAGTILEIGSGTGQHAVHFARHLPHLLWQPSDRAGNLPGISMWAEEAALPNIMSPVVLDVCQQPWPVRSVAGVFSANTAHIMDWSAVEAMFAGVCRVLAAGGRFCLYGPFMRDGQHTSDSNLHFDHMLRQRDPASGIRDLVALRELADTCQLDLADDRALPANNSLLVWQRRS